MTEPNYQKPPLREEIEAFFKQLKGVIIAIIGLATAIAICAGIYKFCRSDIGQQIGAYINKHITELFFLTIITFASYVLLYFALGSKYLIYKRYRLGYFSQMMWCFIGFIALQLPNIPIYLYMHNLIPIIVIELFAIGTTALTLSGFETKRLQLKRPLTKEENGLRKEIINALVSFYKEQRRGLASIETHMYITRSDHADAFARASCLMDEYPELLKTVYGNLPIFYTNTLEELEEKLTIKMDNNRYKLYRERAYNYMRLREDSSVPIIPSLELFFD